MTSVAEQLRGGREAMSLTIHQVAEMTKIKTDHLRALENGEYKSFSAPVYIRGFVRTYARLLKLDVAQVMATLDQELSAIEKFREPPSLGGEAHGVLDFLMLQFSKVNWRMVLPVFGIALVLVLGLYGLRVWRSHQKSDPLSNLGPGLYQPASPGKAQTLPLPTNAPARRK